MSSVAPSSASGETPATIYIQPPRSPSPPSRSPHTTSWTRNEHMRPATAPAHFDQPVVVHASPQQPATVPAYLDRTAPHQPSIGRVYRTGSMPHQTVSHQPSIGHIHRTSSAPHRADRPLRVGYSLPEPAEPFVAVNPWRPKRHFLRSRRDSEDNTPAYGTPGQMQSQPQQMGRAPRSVVINIAGPGTTISEESADVADSPVPPSPRRSRSPTPEIRGTGLGVHSHRTRSPSSTRSDRRPGSPFAPDVGRSRIARPRTTSAQTVEDYGPDVGLPPGPMGSIYRTLPNILRGDAAGVYNSFETLEGPIHTNTVTDSVLSMAAVPPPTSYIAEPLSHSWALPPPATQTKLARRSNIMSTIRWLLLVVIPIIVLDELPQQLYLNFLLRIPSLYFVRVTRIIEEARVSLPDIKRMARARTDEWDEKNTMLLSNPESAPLPRSLLNFKASWDSFIDALLREWNTLNLISALLLSAILTLLQIDAASHPIIRTTALFSLICALMSLLYGCIYIIRFGTMRKMHKASSFASDARRRDVGFWWNVWVLLAMPAIWLSWSIIAFLASIMSFIWLSGSSSDGTDFVLSPRVALGTRIGLTLVLCLGLVYFVLIVREFQRYGDPLDEAWQRAVDKWVSEPTMVSDAPDSDAAATDASATEPQPPIIIQPRSLRPPNSESNSSRTSTPVPYESHSWSHWQPRSDYLRDLRASRAAPAQTLEPPAAFSTPPAQTESFVPQAQPILPVMLMRLGREGDKPRYRIHTQVIKPSAVLTSLRDVSQVALDRFMSDVSSAWLGELVLTRKTGDDTVLNSTYTRVQPPTPQPRLDAPVTPSPVGRGARSSSQSLSTSSEFRNPKDTNGARSLAGIKEENNLSASSLPVPRPRGSKIDGVSTSRSVSDTRSRAQTARRASSEQFPHAQAVQDFLDLWNARYFSLRHFEAMMEICYFEAMMDLRSPPSAAQSDWPGAFELLITLRSRSPNKSTALV